jgi:hypothetical protein
MSCSMKPSFTVPKIARFLRLTTPDGPRRSGRQGVAQIPAQASRAPGSQRRSPARTLTRSDPD